LLRNDRFKKGAISFESPEIKFKLDENGKPLEAYVKERKDAHMLVEDFMLLANRMVAQQIMDFHRTGHPKIPFVYRVHDLPDMEKVNNFANFAARLGYPMKIKSVDSVYSAFNKLLKDVQGKNEQGVLQQLGIRTMAKAAYSTDNIGHFGLAFVDYTHFTSPIRRYADVLVHRIFEQFLNNSPIKYNAIKLEEVCKHISRKERTAMEAERESIKYKQAEYLQDKVGAVFEAFISGMTEFGVYAEIKQNYCEGMIRYENMYDNFVLLEDGFHIRSSERVYKMGDTVWVQIKRVDLSKRQIDLELLREEDAKAALAVSTVENNDSEIQPTVLEIKNNHSFEIDKFLDEVAIAYELSDIAKSSKEQKKEWFYAISETAVYTSSLVYLDFNPLPKKNQKYLAQTSIPENNFDKSKSPKSASLFETYFPEFNLNEVVHTYLSPFRTDSILSEKDSKVSLNLHKKWLKILNPKQIVSFSKDLLDYFIKNKLITEIQNLEIQSSGKNIVLSKGILKSGKIKIQIAFLSDLGLNISKDNKNKILSWLNLG
jgi:ribonuclease R